MVPCGWNTDQYRRLKHPSVRLLRFGAKEATGLTRSVTRLTHVQFDRTLHANEIAAKSAIISSTFAIISVSFPLYLLSANAILEILSRCTEQIAG